MIASVPFRLTLGIGAAGLAGLAAGTAVASGLSWAVIPAVLGALAAIGLLVWSFVSRPADEDARGRLDLLFGDMDDPVQRSVIWRTVLAVIIQLLAARFVEATPEVWAEVERGYGVGAEVGVPVAATVFVLCTGWTGYEMVRFVRIDEFWRHAFTFAAAVGGLAFGVLMVFWLLIGEVARVPQPSFMDAYRMLALLMGAASVWHVMRTSRA